MRNAVAFLIATRSDDDAVFVTLAILLLFIFGTVLIYTIVKNTRELLSPKTIYHRLARFLGPLRTKLEIHDKTYPGYDLASVNRALNSFFSELATSHQAVGALHYGAALRDLLSPTVGPAKRRIKPSTPAYERMPVDVDHEESFVSNCLYMATLKPLPGVASTEPPEKVVLTISTSGSMAYDFDEDMEARTPRATMITLSVACRTRAIADFVFNELERRRKELSIYRGKVIDPVIAPGGIRTIAFKRIKGVTEADLILPFSVKSLIENSIIGFYQHQETLRALGVGLKRGILFNSRPGTGKTSISLYLAGLLPHFTICFVSGRRLLYPRELCAMARYLQPTMLVLEDIDLIATERDMNGLATVLGELMNQIDGCEPTDQVLFIMNTNSMDRLEEAVKNRPGRVDQIIHIPLPDSGARQQLLRHFARNVDLTSSDIEQAASAMDGATPAMIKEVVQRAAVSAVSRDGHTTSSQKLQITAGDLILAFEQCQAMREAKPLGSQVL